MGRGFQSKVLRNQRVVDVHRIVTIISSLNYSIPPIIWNISQDLDMKVVNRPSECELTASILAQSIFA